MGLWTKDGGPHQNTQVSDAYPGLWLGLLAIGIAYGWAYAASTSSWRGPWWRRGLAFGLLSWTLMTLWFEFYLPWNVLREPAALVGVELACWLGVHVLVGVSMAGAYRLIAGPNDYLAPVPPALVMR